MCIRCVFSSFFLHQNKTQIIFTDFKFKTQPNYLCKKHLQNFLVDYYD
jgi:hypothetical protein